MLASWLKKLTRRRRRASVVGAGAGGTRPPEAPAPPSPPSTPPARSRGPDSRDDVREATQEIRRELDRRIQQLRPHVLREANRSDIAAFLRFLRDGPDAVIRQPPVAAQAALTMCQRRTYTVPALTAIIERDPALVQALLRHANSAWYATAGGKPVSAVSPATQRVGTNGVYATVMSRIIEAQLSRPGPEYEVMARQVWDHMVRVAPLARALASHFDTDPEEAYTQGLLHDVGKLIFFDRIADLRRKQRRPVLLPQAFLDEALHSLHEPLGGLACLQWGLSVHLSDVVSNHHRTTDAARAVPGTGLIYLAERLDLERAHGRLPDMADLCEEGGIAADPAELAAALSDHMEMEAQASAAVDAAQEVA